MDPVTETALELAINDRDAAESEVIRLKHELLQAQREIERLRFNSGGLSGISTYPKPGDQFTWATITNTANSFPSNHASGGAVDAKAMREALGFGGIKQPQDRLPKKGR